MQRTRTGLRIELSGRDIEIFRLLCRYRYLRSTYIHAFVGGTSETRFKERLGDLFHEGYLDRPSQQWEFADARCRPVVHELGTGAARVLRESGEGVGEPFTLLGTAAHRQFRHSLMISETLASLELGTWTNQALRLIPWPEILARAPEATRASTTPFRVPVPSGGHVVPDGLFGIEYRAGDAKSYRFFALEADRGTMPVTRAKPGQTSYLAKLAAYGEIISQQVHKKHWGIPNLLVLTLMNSETHVRATLERLRDQADSSAAFLFKAIDASALRTPATQLLFEPWQRVGHAAIGIADEGV